MTGITHAIGGLQAGFIVSALCGQPQHGMLIVETALVGSLLPDIDRDDSRISNSDLFFTYISAKLYGLGIEHREETHTVIAALIYSLLVGLLLLPGTLGSGSANAYIIALGIAFFLDLFLVQLGTIVVGLVVIYNIFHPGGDSTAIFSMLDVLYAMMGALAGYLSHLIYDSANKKGIMWKYPLSKKKYHFMEIVTGEGQEIVFATINLFILGGILSATLF